MGLNNGRKGAPMEIMQIFASFETDSGLRDMVHPNVFEVLLCFREGPEMVDQLHGGSGPKVAQVNFEELHFGCCAD